MNWASGCSSHIPCRTAHGQADRIGPPAPPQTGPARILHNRWEHSVYTVPYFISPYPHIPCCIRQQKRRRPQGIPYPAGSAFAVHTHYHTTVPGSFQACGPFYPNCTFARKKYIIGNNKTTKGADGRAPRKERLYGNDGKVIALLIDAENVSPKYIKTIIDEVSMYGTPAYKRIYGDWTAPDMVSWKKCFWSTT